ncbi:hypothetical protein Tco_0983269 [Tanacetum coccineum]
MTTSTTISTSPNFSTTSPSCFFPTKSDQQSQQHQQPQEEEAVTTLTKSKGKRFKKMSKVAGEERAEGAGTRNSWAQDKELLLAECYIQIYKDPNVASEQKNETFWYKVLDQYNEQSKISKFPVRTKNMLTVKWTPLNREVERFNSLVNETKALSGENDED